MKLNKLILPLVLALVAMLATTGCKHGFSGKTTNLKNSNGGQVGNPEDFQTKPVKFDDGTGNGPGNEGSKKDQFGRTPLSTTLNPDIMDQNRSAFAANTVHFDYDSAVVKDKEQVNLAFVAQTLATDATGAVLIEGNCDERGTEEYNRTLGEHRAEALREALIKNGVSGDRIAVRSYGKDKPADPGHSEAAYAKNRRGEFVLLHPK